MAGPTGTRRPPSNRFDMTGAEIIAFANKRGVTLEIFFDKLRVYSEGEPHESLVILP
jgi:hypothetical protein